MSSFDINVVKRDTMSLKNYVYKTVENVGDALAEEHAALLAFFDARTSGARMARRDDFRPEEIKPYLGSVCILEPILESNGDLADARFRLMGSALAAVYGEMTGRLASEYENAEVSVRFFHGLNLVLHDKKVAIGQASGDDLKATVESSPAPYAKVLMIPLSDDNENVDQVLMHIAVN